jgi:hypothetical protein
MPLLLTNIKAHQRIDDYGSFNDIMNVTMSRHSKIISVELRMNIPVGVVVAVKDGTAVEGVGQRTEYK